MIQIWLFQSSFTEWRYGKYGSAGVNYHPESGLNAPYNDNIKPGSDLYLCLHAAELLNRTLTELRLSVFNDFND